MNKKTILSILLVMAIAILFSTTVYATETFSVKLSSNKETLKAGDELEVILKMDEFSEEGNGIGVVLGNLEYNKSIFETVTSEDITVLNYWETPTFNSENGKLLLDTYNFVKESHEAVKIKFKVKNKIKEATSAEIKFTNIVGSNGDEDIEVDDATITLNIEKSSNFVASLQENNNIWYIIAGAVILVVIVAGVTVVIIKKSKKNKDA